MVNFKKKDFKNTKNLKNIKIFFYKKFVNFL